LVVEIIQGKTTVAEASRAYDLSPSEIEGWVDDAKRGMENALRANPLEIREQYEKRLKDLVLSRIRAAPSARLGHLAFECQGAFPSQC
jgi:transposase-like protein